VIFFTPDCSNSSAILIWKLVKFLDVPLSIRSYPYLDDLDATIEAYRAEKNAEPWPMEEERERQLGEVP
jgi:hypothetical protein